MPWAEHQEERSYVRLLSFLLRVPQMQIGAKQLCKKLHILQKLSFLTTQTKGLASVQDGRAEWSYVEHGPLLSNFCELPVAVVFLRCSSHLLLFGPWFISLCAPPPDFAHLLTAANHGCGEATTSGRTCPRGRFSLLRLSSNLKICIHCKNSHP